MLTGFSQVLLALESLQVVVAAEASLVVEELRLTIRVGNQDLVIEASSPDNGAIRRPMGTRGPIIRPLARAIISSIFAVFSQVHQAQNM